MTESTQELATLIAENQQQKIELDLVFQQYAKRRDTFDGLSQEVAELEKE